MHTHSIHNEHPEQRLDKYLSTLWPQVSRSVIQKSIASGNVLVNQKIAKASTVIRGGDNVSYQSRDDFEDTQKPKIWQPNSIPLNILFEDAYLVVINKSPGVVMHPGAGTQSQITLMEGLMHHLGLKAQRGDIHPWRLGLLHRLDKDTSGVVVVAKDAHTHAHLTKQFSQRTSTREYVALLAGCLKKTHTEVESYLYRSTNSRTRYTSITPQVAKKTFQDSIPPNYRYAKSTFTRRITFAGRFDLCTIKLTTGRTHQIRVQAQSLKTPILGDPTYKVHRKCPYCAFLKALDSQNPHSLSRQLLHARTLGFVHPYSKKTISITSPLPQDFRDVIQTLYQYAESPEDI